MIMNYESMTKSSYIYAGLAIFFWSTVPTAFKISLGELAYSPNAYHCCPDITSAVPVYNCINCRQEN